jgi:hypothetical protein
MTQRVLMEGSCALAEAAIQVGCRFYAGYPITPSTEILEYMSVRLPQVGGVCMNAESEIEAIGMVWGAAGCGVRAMIASTGQGISLMQESFAELANAQIPILAVNMARGQGDYFQATRGGGPPFRRFGARPLYRWSDAIAWAESRLSSLHRSTSEYLPGTMGGRTDPHENISTKLPGENRPGSHMAYGRWGQQMWLSNDDWRQVVQLARELSSLGFKLLATRGTVTGVALPIRTAFKGAVCPVARTRTGGLGSH